MLYTLKNEIRVEGIGLHTGRHAKICLIPLSDDETKALWEEHQSLWMFRIEEGGRGSEFPVIPEVIKDEFRSTTLGIDNRTVSTVEHLLSALFALRIGGLIIHIQGNEVPILDGSAQPWVEIILDNRIPRSLSAPTWEIHDRLSVTHESDRWIQFEPNDSFGVRYEIEFDHPLIGHQEAEWAGDETTYIQKIAPARTFGFKKHADMLFRQNRARGASLKNVLVLTEDGLMNPPLRLEKEFVYHKILDFIGDLALLGGILPPGRYSICKGSHAMHHAFVRVMYEKWCRVKHSFVLT